MSLRGWRTCIAASSLTLTLGCATRDVVGSVRIPLQAAIAAADQCRGSLRLKGGTFILESGRVVCFSGPTDRAAASVFLSAPINSESMIVLNSKGGDMFAALDMAGHLQEKGASVVVDGLCISSCGNYLFMAGKKKFVLDGSYVGFHGGIEQGMITVTCSGGAARCGVPGGCLGPSDVCDKLMQDPSRIDATVRDVERAGLKQQTEFYALIGVRPDVMTIGPRQLAFHPGALDFDRSKFEHTFWEYGPDLLRDRFGVTGIEYFAFPEAKRGLSYYISRSAGISCHELDPEEWLCNLA